MTENELRQAFLKAANGNVEDAHNFFNRGRYKEYLFHENQNPAKTIDEGINLLNSCRQIDEEAFGNIHKGTAYYWIACAFFLVRDYELASFFFDAAVTEDVKNRTDFTTPYPPSFLFILIDGTNPNQAAHALVKSTQARFDELLVNYNSRCGAYLIDLQYVRDHFLRRAISLDGDKYRSLATALISFGMEWDFRNTLFDICPTQGTSEPFLLHLFKGCVLFESLLKCNPCHPLNNPRGTLSNALQDLHNELMISPNLPISDLTFSQIIATALAQPDNVNIQTAIQYTGRIRNKVGHNLGWGSTFDKITYHRLFRMISSSCFHAIACLYK